MNTLNPIFKLKQSLAGIFSAHKEIDNVIESEKKIYDSEDRLFAKIADFEHNSEYVQQLRSDNRNNILRLQNALARVDTQDVSKFNENFVIEERNIKEWRSYEKNLRNQVTDIKIIIELLKKIIDAEREEVLLDIETPFDVIEEYFKRLKKVLVARKQTFESYPVIQSVLDRLKESTTHLIELTIKYVDNQYKFFNQDYSINEYFKNRGKLKQQLNGKTQAILAQIGRLEDALKSIESEDNREFAKAVLTNVSYFKKQFEELIQFCTDRVDISNTITLEAVSLQRKKEKDLEFMKSSMDTLYSEFLKQQTLKRKEFKKNESKYLEKQTAKRIEEFDSYQRSLNNDTRKLSKLIVDVEEEDLKTIQKESDPNSIKAIRGRIVRWQVKTAAVFTLFAGINILVPGQIAESSTAPSSAASSRYVMALSVVGNKNTETLKPLLNSLPKEFFSQDTTARKKLLGEVLNEGAKIDTALAKLGVGPRDYLKNLALERTFNSNSSLTASQKHISDSLYIEKVEKAILLNNPILTNKASIKAYMHNLIKIHAPRILPKGVPIELVEAILSQESSSRNIFAVNNVSGASGAYQIMKNTFKIFTPLEYLTFVRDPEINCIVALMYIRELYYQIPADAYLATDWARLIPKNLLVSGINPQIARLCVIGAAYNYGPSILSDKDMNILRAPQETQDYAKYLYVYFMDIPKYSNFTSKL